MSRLIGVMYYGASRPQPLTPEDAALVAGKDCHRQTVQCIKWFSVAAMPLVPLASGRITKPPWRSLRFPIDEGDGVCSFRPVAWNARQILLHYMVGWASLAAILYLLHLWIVPRVPDQPRPISRAQPPSFLMADYAVPYPARTRYVEPAYPNRTPARPNPASGLVLLMVYLDESGRPLAVKASTDSSADKVVGEVARAAALKWRYQPTVVDGVRRRVLVFEAVAVFPTADERSRRLAALVADSSGAYASLRPQAIRQLMAVQAHEPWALEALRRAKASTQPLARHWATVALEQLRQTRGLRRGVDGPIGEGP